MSKPAKLHDIIEALDFSSEESRHYFDRTTGRVELVTDEDMSAAEDEELEEDAPDWQRDSIDLARAIADDTSNRFVPLPDSFDLDEWAMMERFADQTGQDTLLDAIQGKGAFRRFKDAIHRLGLADRWYAFRADELRTIALEWCRDNDIEVDDTPPSPHPPA
jgi:Uncharacterised protein family (UPF0158)